MHRTASRWSDADKCALWLGIWQVLFVPYLLRVNYLLAHPEIEPYFDRGALALFRIGLLAVILVSFGLFAVARTAALSGRRLPWLPYVTNQLTGLWIVAAAYAVGPVTNPVLALLVLAAFLSALLFTRAVVLSSLLSALLLLILLTLLERAEVVPYAPLFAQPPVVAGRVAEPYIIGTGLAAAVIILLSGCLALYLVDQRRAREADLVAAGEARRHTAADLERALDSLRDSEELFRQLAENTREVFWMIDRDSGGLLYLGPGFDKMWGIPRAALFERLEAFLDPVHPDDRARLEARLGRLGEALQSDDASEIEYRIRRPDGEVRWVHIHAFPIRDANGRIYRLGGLLDDVTERKATEAALLRAQADLERRVAERTAALSEANERLTLEAAERTRAELLLRDSEEQLRRQLAELDQLYRTAPIGLALHDTELRFVRINERLAAINGRSVEEHLGRKLHEVLPEISQTVEPLIRGVIESGEAVLDMEFRGATPAEPDVERHWLTSYYPLKAEDGRVIGVNSIVADISERAWAEERARRHLEDLAHVSRLSTMGEMAAGIAHELNQPLAAMANFAFIGMHRLEGHAGEEATALRGLFTDLSEQALRAGEIVQHLRAFIKRSNPQRQLVAVNDLINDVLRLIEPEMRPSGVRLEIRGVRPGPQMWVDAIQLQQVTLNLLRNALEAMAEMPSDARRLRITSTVADGFVEISVADSGPGLPRGDCARVFDAFFTTKATGMGMGLAISRSIVEDHGGRLWAESPSGGGAIFRMVLPIARAA